MKLVTAKGMWIDGMMPNNCITNVEKHAAECGGRVVSGWRIKADRRAPIEEWIHHAIWESPQGEYIDITPQILARIDEQALCVLEDIHFVIDESAEFKTDEIPSCLPTRWVAADDNPKLRRVVEYMNRSEGSCHEGKRNKQDATHRQKSTYWLTRANKILFDSYRMTIGDRTDDEYALAG